MTSQNRVRMLQILILALSIGNFGCGNSSAPVLPVVVSVSPKSATVPANGTQSFAAMVSNDPSAAGVSWTVSCSTPPCGSVSPT